MIYIFKKHNFNAIVVSSLAGTYVGDIVVLEKGPIEIDCEDVEEFKELELWGSCKFQYNLVFCNKDDVCHEYYDGDDESDDDAPKVIQVWSRV